MNNAHTTCISLSHHLEGKDGTSIQGKISDHTSGRPRLKQSDNKRGKIPNEQGSGGESTNLQIRKLEKSM